MRNFRQYRLRVIKGIDLLDEFNMQISVKSLQTTSLYAFFVRRLSERSSKEENPELIKPLRNVKPIIPYIHIITKTAVIATDPTHPLIFV